MAWRNLTTQPWDAIRAQLPQVNVSPRGGRPRVEDRRGVEGIRWRLWTGSQWRELPRRYGRATPCWRRLKDGAEMGGLRKRWRAFWAHLNDQPKIRWDACGAEGSGMPEKQGEPTSARRHAGRGHRGWCWSMARVLR